MEGFKASASAKASVVNIEGNSVNLPSGGDGKGIEHLVRLMSPVRYERREAAAREVELESFIKTAKRLKEEFPAMGDRRAVLEALGYRVTNEQADNVASVFESAHGLIEDLGGTTQVLPPATRDSIVEGASKAYDDDVKVIWARILAGELENPGSHSRSLLGLLANIDSSQASIFSKLCTYIAVGCVPGDPGLKGDRLLVLEKGKDASTFNEGVINYIDLGVCASLGLIDTQLFVKHSVPPKAAIMYIVGRRVLTAMNNTDGDLECNFGGAVLLPLGNELSSLCECGTAPNLPDILERHFKNAGFDVGWTDFNGHVE